jgi:hypothetical protein
VASILRKPPDAVATCAAAHGRFHDAEGARIVAEVPHRGKA